MNYIQALYFFAFKSRLFAYLDYPYMELVFLGACLITGLMIICLDYACYFLTGRSILQLRYNTIRKHWLIFIIWPLMSVFAGCLYLCSGLELTIRECVICGVAWMPIAITICNFINRSDSSQ